MARKELSVEPRQVVGKKVAQMRRMGILPGNVYGKGLESVSVQIATEELEHTLKAATANEVIDVKIAGEKDTRPVVIHRIQRHPINDRALHADFYQVSLRDKMRADVPLVVIGESEAVKTYNGVLVTSMDTVSIEALPLDIPVHFEIDISHLAELESAIHVRDLTVPGNVTILSDPDMMIVKVAAPSVSEDIEPTEAAEGAEEPTAEAGEGADASGEESPEAEAES